MTHLVALVTVLVMFLAVTDVVNSWLITNVTCVGHADKDRGDNSWVHGTWHNGVEHFHVDGDKSTKTCDQFLESYKEAGFCVWNDALVCKLTTSNIDIGAVWMDTAGSTQYPGSVFVMVKQKNLYRWVSRSKQQCHGHKIRVQFFGKQTGKNPSACLRYCVVQRPIPEN